MKSASRPAALILSFAEGEGFLAVSDGRYKLVRVSQGDRQHIELIDLEADPHEFVNFADDPTYHAHRARLQGQMVDLLMGQCAGIDLCS